MIAPIPNGNNIMELFTGQYIYKNNEGNADFLSSFCRIKMHQCPSLGCTHTSDTRGGLNEHITNNHPQLSLSETEPQSSQSDQGKPSHLGGSVADAGSIAGGLFSGLEDSAQPGGPMSSFVNTFGGPGVVAGYLSKQGSRAVSRAVTRVSSKIGTIASSLKSSKGSTPKFKLRQPPSPQAGSSVCDKNVEDTLNKVADKLYNLSTKYRPTYKDYKRDQEEKLEQAQKENEQLKKDTEEACRQQKILDDAKEVLDIPQPAQPHPPLNLQDIINLAVDNALNNP